MELQGKKMNVIGDSITEGVGVSCEENIFINVLGRNEKLSVVRDYGVSGTRITPQADDPGRSYVERFDKMDDDADIVVVFGGTNDYGHGAALLGTKDDRTPETFYGACHTLFEGLVKKYPLATIVVVTPVQRNSNPDYNRINPLRHDATLLDFVNILKEVAMYYAIPVLDLYAISGIHPQIECNRVNYCPDGLHPNDNGHALMASRLAGFLKTL